MLHVVSERTPEPQTETPLQMAERVALTIVESETFVRKATHLAMRGGASKEMWLKVMKATLITAFTEHPQEILTLLKGYPSEHS